MTNTFCEWLVEPAYRTEGDALMYAINVEEEE